MLHLYDQRGRYITDAERVEDLDFMLDDSLYGADAATVEAGLKAQGYTIRHIEQKGGKVHNG